jgi:PAS domain S-box-containing protein
VSGDANIAAKLTGRRGRPHPSDRSPSSELQHRLLFEHNPLPMMVYERKTLRVIAVSNAAVASYGYSREEFVTLTLRDLTPAEDLELMEAFFAANLSGKRPGLVSGPRRHRCKSGSIIDVEITGDDLEFGGRGCRLVLCQDVTERNRAMAELMQAREQLNRRAEEHRLLFERNPQPMLAYDCETLRIVAVSDASIANAGYSREEFLAMTLLDIAPEEDHAAMLEYARVNRGKRLGLQHARPRRHRRKDGTIIDVEVTSDDLVLGERQCRVCLCQDVTERNRASAEQISRSGEQMLAIINDILDISKIETGHLELDITDFDLHETIDGTCSFATAQARAKGLRLDLRIGSEVPRRVRGDGRRLHQVVLNLVSNAIKFTSTRRGHGSGQRTAANADRQWRQNRCGGCRQRHRYRSGEPAAHLRAVHTGRRVDDAPVRRNRTWAGDRPRARRADGWDDQRRERARPRQHVSVRAGARARRRRRRATACPGGCGACRATGLVAETSARAGRRG